MRPAEVRCRCCVASPESIFWLNRYVERAISIIRVVDVTAHLELDSGDPDASGIDYWTPLLRAALDTVPHDGEDESPTPLPQDVRYYLPFDPDNSTSLLSCIRQARSAAGEVRDLEEDLHAFYRQVRDSLLLIQGLDIGRDYHDVPPTRGTFQGGGTERLTVAVTVRARY